MFNKLKEFVFGKPKAESSEPVAPYKVEPPAQPAVEAKKPLPKPAAVKKPAAAKKAAPAKRSASKKPAKPKSA